MSSTAYSYYSHHINYSSSASIIDNYPPENFYCPNQVKEQSHQLQDYYCCPSLSVPQQSTSSLLTHQNINDQFETTTSNSNNYGYYQQLPLFQLEENTTGNSSNVLQDDNFSIVTASDLYYNITSPSLLSTTQLTPYSTPSPQISAITGDATASTAYYDTSYNSHYTLPDLFAPVQQQQRSEHSQNNNKSKKLSSNTTIVTEKRHICPICSHRSKRRHNLVEHMLTHNPQRPKSFLCGHCSRPFARKYDMKRHEKIHTRR